MFLFLKNHLDFQGTESFQEQWSGSFENQSEIKSGFG